MRLSTGDDLQDSFHLRNATVLLSSHEDNQHTKENQREGSQKHAIIILFLPENYIVYSFLHFSKVKVILQGCRKGNIFVSYRKIKSSR